MANNNGSRKLKWSLILIGGVVVLGGGVWYFVRKDNSDAQYETAPVTRGNLVQVVTATGQLDPVVNVQVGSQISGIIKKLYVDYNSVVKSNQLVAEIDPATYQVNVLKAEADVANAKATLELNQVEARRADSLFNDKLISASDHDTATAQLHQAEAQVQSDAATLKNTQVQLSYCTIYAPVDGVVISRNVDVGQTVASSFSTPTLFLIANDLTKMQIDALVSEADIGGVATNQNVSFTVDAYPFRTFRGKVSQIRYGPQTNQNVVCYDAVVEVNNADLKLLPGMTANVSIITAERENTLKIPNAALRFRPPEAAGGGTNGVAATESPAANISTNAGNGGDRGGGIRGAGGGRAAGGGQGGSRPDKSSARTVYILDATKNPDHPELRPARIKTGINDGVSTEVIEGLKEGDQLVTALLSSSSEASSRPSNPFGGGRRF